MVSETINLNKPDYFGNGFTHKIITAGQAEQDSRQPILFGDLLQTHGSNPNFINLNANAYQLALNAVMAQEVIQLRSGHKEFTFFTHGNDEYQIRGGYLTQATTTNYLRSMAARGGRDGMMIFVAPTGAGKSTIVNRLKVGLADYINNQNDIFCISDCLVHENPFHLIPKPDRELFKSKTGIEITGSLCPDCQIKLESDEIGFNPLKMKVERLRFNPDVSRGIGVIEPRLSHFYDLESQHALNSIVLGSNRGILEFPEFCKIYPEYYNFLSDFLRGRFYRIRNKSYQLDNVIIGHTTLDEWEEFIENPERNSLRERIQVIYIPYMTSRNDEVAVYEKQLGLSKAGAPHMPPDTLKYIATIPILSRFESSVGPTAKQKLEYYDGSDIEGYTQSQRKEIEKEASERKEGFTGISPPTMMEFLSHIVIENPDCFSPTKALTGIKHMIEQVPKFVFPKKSQWVGFVEQTIDDFNRYIQQLIIQAYRDNFQSAYETHKASYLEYLEWSKDGIPLDKYIKGEPPIIDYNYMIEIEKLSMDKKPEDVVLDTEIFKFRDMVLRSTTKEGGKFVFVMPSELDRGLKLKTMKTAEDIEDILAALTPDEKQKKILTTVAEHLIANYGFCVICAPESIRYVGNQIRRARRAKS